MPTTDNKSARLYRHGLSRKQIQHQLGYPAAKVLEQLSKAGIKPDPAREVGKRPNLPPEHLVGVAGLPEKWTTLLRKHQPQTPEDEAELDAEMEAAKARVKEASIALKVREVCGA